MARSTDPDISDTPGPAGQAHPAGPRPRRLRRTAAIGSCLVALAATTLAAGPAVVLPAADPCALPRTDVHHSEGLDTWNPLYPRPLGRMDALMLFFSFPDWRPTVRPAELYADHFPATADFLSTASYGRLDLRAHPVDRWMRMPSPSTSYGIQRDWSGALRGAFLRDALHAADPDVDFSDYDVIYLVADPGAPGVDSDATKVVNFDVPLRLDGVDISRLVTVFEQHPPDRHVLAHETGHVFDLPDLYRQPADGKGDWDTEVGDWDLMGSQFGLSPDPFGWHKWKLGWLRGPNVGCAPDTPGRSGTYALRPLEVPLEERARRDTRLVVARLGPQEVLAMEVRTRAGNDVEGCRSGVLLYRVRADAESAEGPVTVVDGAPSTSACLDRSVYPPLGDAPLRTGDTHREPVAGGGEVRVRVGERNEWGGWDVTVQRR